MEASFDDAVDAYRKYCEDNLLIFRQPGENASDVGRKYIHLRNSNEDLARYVIATGEILIP